MEDLKLLKHARHYIASMAQGINPLNGEFASDGDTISRERIQKCCDYVAGLLDKIIENGGEIGKSPRKSKKEFSITPQQMKNILVFSRPIGINDVAKQINTVCEKGMKKITGAQIASWLANNGYLDVISEETQCVSFKTKKVLNDRSKELGIISTKSVDKKTGEVYEKLLYNEYAQRFIIQNLDDIAASNNSKA